ncbi:MAG: precorrin-6A reductase [Lachnospiraceae bacterium]|nr:precorrin-6A reductase [Lachnospiraceae bacterium]
MNILIFGGTSEAHSLSDDLTDSGIAHTLSVATKYGEQVLGSVSSVRRVCVGRLDDIAITEFIKKDGYDLIIDATHPYATKITENICKAVRCVNDSSDSEKVRAVRLIRECDKVNERLSTYDKAYTYSDADQAASCLKNTSGNILLTTGSKDLSIYTQILGPDSLPRLYARVIPSIESINACEEAGIDTSHIIAMQGPFGTDINKALIRQYDIRHIVTKDSGMAGGTKSKTDAAIECGISVHMISRPADSTGIKTAGYREVLNMIVAFAGADKHVSERYAVSSPDGAAGKEPLLSIRLIGMGMGDEGSITKEAYRIIKDADVVLGSKRLIDICKAKLHNDKAKYAPIYKPQEIVDYIDDHVKRHDVSSNDKPGTLAILFSGDSGFNSGCKNVYEAISQKIKDGVAADLRICPGISSVSYLASRIGRSYDEAFICSMHGKGEESIYRAASYVRINSDVYTLTGGCKDILKLAGILSKAGLGECMITAASDMSSPYERIVTDSADRYSEGAVLKDDDADRSLYTCHIYNPAPIERNVAAGLSPEEFIRGDVPMTKEEVRAVTIDKLKLRPGSRVLDIGCGTGSVTVEIAGLIPDGMVYAYDISDKAVELTVYNVRAHRLPNVVVRKGSVPEVICSDEGFSGEITHAFIGGNKGRLTHILDCLKEMSIDQAADGGIRVVLNAITDKTRDTLKSWISDNEVHGYDLVKVGVSRSDELIPENEVYIYSFVL